MAFGMPVKDEGRGEERVGRYVDLVYGAAVRQMGGDEAGGGRDAAAPDHQRGREDHDQEHGDAAGRAAARNR